MSDEQTIIRRLYADSAAALSGGDISALAVYYTQDAIQLPPNTPALVGWQAILVVAPGFRPISAESTA
jgi:ketosteroid isomerase-like protein